ncbi:MAG: hypothetical protein GY710_24270 [Desulfobacteraceae bacterium]|nr:hypothetical protein [Desulfobacteraceae bacterium]
MTKVYITQAATITPLGNDPDTLYKKLIQKESGLTDMSDLSLPGTARFNPDSYASPWAGLIPNLIPNLTPNLIPNGEPKNFPHDPVPLIFSLADQLIRKLGPIDPDTCLITASTKGGIDLLPEFAKNPDLLPRGLAVSSLPGYISQKLGLRRPGFNISAACASSTIALAKGAAMIQNGREEAVLICAMDVITKFVFSGFSALGAMSPTQAAPFDKKRKGITLGEGAAGILLTNEKKLKSIKKTALARISGWGAANDASHLTAPARNGAGLKLAITKACQKAKISFQDIQAVNTHGTGTLYNDEMELNVLKDLFNPDTIMANSIKGAIGHTLGAAGAIEAALCTKLLEKKILPGTLGFAQGAAGQIISSHARPFAKGPIMTTNSGFGGINAALIIQEVA